MMPIFEDDGVEEDGRDWRPGVPVMRTSTVIDRFYTVYLALLVWLSTVLLSRMHSPL